MAKNVGHELGGTHINPYMLFSVTPGHEDERHILLTVVVSCIAISIVIGMNILI